MTNSLPLDSRVKAWQHQPNEDDREYQMFSHFLTSRDLNDVVETFFEDIPTGAAEVSKISRLKKWRERARAFDNWVTEQRDDAIRQMVQNETKENAKRRVKLVRGLYREIDRAGRDLKNRNVPDPRRISAQAKLIKAFFDLTDRMEADNMAGVAQSQTTSAEGDVQNSKQALREQMARIAERNSKNAPPDKTPPAVVQ